MVEKLTREHSLAKDSIEKKDVELAKANSSIDSLKSANETLQKNFSCLEVRYKDLEVQFNTLWDTNSSPPSANLDSNVSTSKGCKQCYNHDINICSTNLAKLGKLEKEVKLLKIVLKNEMLTNEDGSMKDVTKFKPLRNNKSRKALGHNPNKQNPREIINGQSCLKFNKGMILHDVMNKIHCSNTTTPSQAKDTKEQVKQVKKETLTPISKSYTCDICQLGTIMVKWLSSYVGAHIKKNI